VAQEFRLPDIGEGLVEATIISWYVGVGDEIGMDEPLVEVETDKAVTDLPSPFAGTLLFQGGEPGDVIPVETLLAVVGDTGENWSPASASEPTNTAPTKPETAAPIVGSLAESTSSSSRIRALPKTRRLATKLGVDITRVVGSGPGGRISEEDVRSAASESTPSVATSTGPERRVPMTSLRKKIAEHLTRSWREIPHVTTYGEADASAMLAGRAAAGKPPLEALLMKAIVPLLVEFPAFNASIDGDTIVEKLHYDLGFAVATPDGLMVAVVRDVNDRSVDELGAEIIRLSVATRERKAGPAELRGQTFTISNIGAVGGRYGTPIVPYGTTGILGIGRADQTPVVRDGEVVVGREFPLSLSYDHRAIDGSTGRAFMGALIESLESFS
jgi:pyruvate dehydrogenase E2 component (dihydrolipoyllysine-residue acetyltransferase)